MTNNSFINNLNWRFAVKDFDPNKKIDSEDLKKIIYATRMAPTSFGLQPFHVFVISDNRTKEKIKKHSYNQNQITECEYLLVFCAKSDTQKRTGEYIKLAGKGKSFIQKGKLKGFETMVRGFFATRRDDDFALNWAKQQTYLALGFALAACAELKVDSCPMEGFISDKVDKDLGLDESTKSSVLLAIGTRKNNPTRDKIRFDEEELITYIS